MVCKTLENQILSNNKNRDELKYSGKVCSSSQLVAPVMSLSIEIQWLGEKISTRLGRGICLWQTEHIRDHVPQMEHISGDMTQTEHIRGNVAQMVTIC